MSADLATQTSSETDWGILARSIFWVLQSWFVNGTAFLLIQMKRGDRFVEVAIAIVASVITAVLLFRQVAALIDQRLE